MTLSIQAGHPTTMPLDALVCDAFEEGLLPIARHFWLAISRKDTVAWHRAYTIAAERYGERIGFPLGHQLAKIMRILKDLRGSGLEILDPLDLAQKSQVTNDEALLVAMIHHMRRDETPSARNAVDALTEGRMDPEIIRAGLHLASRFPSGAPEKTPPAAQARLFAVK